jgi:ParB-like chromosome segregation protein Spo0J
MFALIIMAVGPWMSLCQALPVGEYQRAGPLYGRSSTVTDGRKVPDNPAPPATAPPEETTPETGTPETGSRVIRVRLSDLVILNYSHRAKEAKERALLQPLMESIKAQRGLKHPPEVYRRPDGSLVVVTGHRRIESLRLLAKDGVAGFADDMEIEVVELLGTTVLDRLAWSVEDNETRLNLTAAERFGVVAEFQTAGLSDDRGAIALGLSLTQYRRDLMLVRNEWMIALIEKKAIGATTAVELLQVAEKTGREMELKTFVEDWVAAAELDIEAEGLKRELKPAEKLVRTRLTPELKKHWLDRLATGKELNTKVEAKVKASFNPKTLEVAVAGFKLNLQTDPVEKIAKELGRLSQIAKDAAPILRTRVALEGGEGPQAKLIGGKDSPRFDPEFLKDAGVEDLVQPQVRDFEKDFGPK